MSFKINKLDRQTYIWQKDMRNKWTDRSQVKSGKAGSEVYPGPQLLWPRPGWVNAKWEGTGEPLGRPWEVSPGITASSTTSLHGARGVRTWVFCKLMESGNHRSLCPSSACSHVAKRVKHWTHDETWLS